MQNLAEHYREAGFLKTYGNVSEAAKYLFKERLKARVTPTFYFFRNGGAAQSACCLPGVVHNACVMVLYPAWSERLDYPFKPPPSTSSGMVGPSSQHAASLGLYTMDA